eukprot:TRINITY_DN7723_c0_g1_i1.p1 TRINITY_DN7723_c0_g1~~TRINITY_DN7723_c0_g1_i1.p1  ORF type:complete len:136 (-),score=17.34 TRINITY_DN7723_c0_g1_i1:161-568(-)
MHEVSGYAHSSDYSSSVKDTPIKNISEHDGGGWILVRQIKKGRSWHQANDNLLGTEKYNEDNGLSFSHIFVHEYFNEFLFTSIDRKKWMIASKDSVSGEFYSGKKRPVEKSSRDENSYQAVWHNRDGRDEDHGLA